jgi:hypothetical protein
MRCFVPFVLAVVVAATTSVQDFVSFLKGQIQKVAIEQFQDPLEIIQSNPQVVQLLEEKWQTRAIHAFIYDFQSNYQKIGKISPSHIIHRCKKLWMVLEADEIAFEFLLRNIHSVLPVKTKFTTELMPIYQALIECLLDIAKGETEESFLLNQTPAELSDNPCVDNGSEMIRLFFEYRTNLTKEIFIHNMPIDEILKDFLVQLEPYTAKKISMWKKIASIQFECANLSNSLVEIVKREKKAAYKEKFLFFLLADASFNRIKAFNDALEAFEWKNLQESVTVIKVAYYPMFWAVSRLDKCKAAEFKPWDMHYSHLLQLGTLTHELNKWNFWF